MSPKALLLLTCAIALLFVPATAQAYMDPGTGSFLVQGIIAGLIGAGMAIKLFWHRIKAVITGQAVKEDDDDE